MIVVTFRPATVLTIYLYPGDNLRLRVGWRTERM
jgi:hypothetical protein